VNKPMRSPTPFEVAYATRLCLQNFGRDAILELHDRHPAFACIILLLRSIGAPEKDASRVLFGIAIAEKTLEIMGHDYTDYWLKQECEKLDQEAKREAAAKKAKEN